MPDLLVIGGPNGAGKSTVAPGLIGELLGRAPFVNADVIARGIAGPGKADEVAYEAGRRALERVRDLLEARSSFAFESTLSSRTLANTLSRARADGYLVTVAYVWVPSAEVAIERVARRVAGGGHDIPADVIRRRYGRSLANLRELYLPLADAFRIYDHSVAGEPKRIAERAKGSRPIVYDDNAWMEIRRSMEEAGQLREELATYDAEEELSRRILNAMRICTGDALLKHKLLRQPIVTYDLEGNIFHIPPDEIVTHLTPEEEAEAIATAGHGTWFVQ
jgi:predicted ABC-type ATPase